MQIVERVLAGTYYAWGQMFLTCVQRQLTAAKEAGKGFCFGLFLVAFFMERVPTLRPRMPVRDGGPRDPRMIWWGEMMRRRGDGNVGRYFTQELYMQWLQLPLALEDYPYRGMDYTGDPDGMYNFNCLVQFFFMLYMIYMMTDN